MTDLQPKQEIYESLLQDLKRRIRESQLRAAVSVNRELVLLYWRMGRDILVRRDHERWGAKVIDRLAKELKQAFPEMKGFSPRNLKCMRTFTETWPDELIVQQVAAQIPWFHNCVLLDKLNRQEERAWYATAALQHGWGIDVLRLRDSFPRNFS